MDFLIIFLAKYFFIFVLIAAIIVTLMEPKKNLVNILKLAIAALPVSFIFSRIASALFYNPRPFVVEKIAPLIDHAADNGFPSDHTLIVMTVTAIVFAYNKKTGFFLILFSLIVGLGRVLAKVHHSLDVLGSTLIAFLATYLCFAVLKKLKILR